MDWDVLESFAIILMCEAVFVLMTVRRTLTWSVDPWWCSEVAKPHSLKPQSFVTSF